MRLSMHTASRDRSGKHTHAAPPQSHRRAELERESLTTQGARPHMPQYNHKCAVTHPGHSDRFRWKYTSTCAALATGAPEGGAAYSTLMFSWFGLYSTPATSRGRLAAFKALNTCRVNKPSGRDALLHCACEAAAAGAVLLPTLSLSSGHTAMSTSVSAEMRTPPSRTTPSRAPAVREAWRPAFSSTSSTQYVISRSTRCSTQHFLAVAAALSKTTRRVVGG